MHKENFHRHESRVELIGLLSLFFFILTLGYLTTSLGFSLSYLSRAQTPWQKQGTFEFAHTLKVVPELPTGGTMSDEAGVYCNQDEDPSGCEEGSAFHLPKGKGGKSGKCGRIIEQAQTLARNLKSDKSGLKSVLAAPVTACDYTIDSYPEGGYISTYFVIDAYNLAGFTELSKRNSDQILGRDLLRWFQGNPKGYAYVSYTPTLLRQYATGQKDLTGCAVFIDTPSGVHTGIVNSIQMVNTNGDGILTVLQSRARYLIERLEIVGWKFRNTALSDKQYISPRGFGCKL